MEDIKTYEAWVFIKETERKYLYTICAPSIQMAQEHAGRLAIQDHCPWAKDVYVQIRETTMEEISHTISELNFAFGGA